MQNYIYFSFPILTILNHSSIMLYKDVSKELSRDNLS